MKLNLRTLCLTSSLFAVMSVAAVAHADGLVSGTVYCGISGPSSSNPQGAAGSFALTGILSSNLGTTGTGTQCATFTSTSISFDAGYGNTIDTLNGFLTSDPNSHTTITSGGSTATGSELGDLYILTGSTYLTAGELITLSHDDGAVIYITGNGLTNYLITPPGSAIQTMAGEPAFTLSGDVTSGEYSYQILYVTNYEAPSELISNIAAAPEPSSFVLLGSGLFAAAGIVRRRLR
jgi:hypothetical protein